MMKAVDSKFLRPRLRAIKAILFFAAIVFASLFAFARLVASIPDTILPFPDQAIQLSGMPATFQTAVLPKWEIGQRISLPSDNQDLISKFNGAIPEAVYIEGTGSRLTVVIPGLGGNSTDSMNVWFARPFISGGDSILILPSPSHPDFFEHHLTSFDFQRANQALCKVVKVFVSGKHFKRNQISRVLLAGYSLGGRSVLEMPACLADYFSLQKLNLEVFSMNPPLDLEYAASVLDEALESAKGQRQIREFAEVVLFGLYTRLMAFSFGDFEGTIDIDESRVILAARRWGFFLEKKDSVLKKLIATLFAHKLTPTLRLASNNEGNQLRERDDFAFRVLLPNLPGSAPINLNRMMDRVQNLRVQTRGRVFILHSADDFLIRPRELEVLLSLAPQHVLALHSGGHVGAIFKPEYLTGFNLGRRLGVFPSVNDPRNEH